MLNTNQDAFKDFKKITVVEGMKKKETVDNFSWSERVSLPSYFNNEETDPREFIFLSKVILFLRFLFC